jgi:RNA polymerase sigma-70 factor (ECF subfamily)
MSPPDLIGVVTCAIAFTPPNQEMSPMLRSASLGRSQTAVARPSAGAAPGSDALEERSLVEAARFDPEAFGVLYQHYLPRIYRYLRFRSATETDAADLTQDVFVRAFAAFPRFRDDGTPFAAWLFTIARNRSADAARRNRRHGISVPLGDGLVAADDPEGALLRREAASRVGRLIAELDPDKRELVSLRFSAGLTCREISVVVGRSEPAVKQQLTRILRRLKEQTNER